MSKPPHMTTGRYAPPAPERELTAVSADGAPLHVELYGPRDAPALVFSPSMFSTAGCSPARRRRSATATG